MKKVFKSLRQQVARARGFVTAVLFAAVFLGSATRALAGDNVLGFGAAGQRVTTTGKITTINFTAEAWFKQTNSLAENQIFSQYAGGAGRLIVAVKDGMAGMFIGTWMTGTVAIPFDTWTHIAVTRNNSTCTIYINGTLYMSGTINANALDTTGFMIGNITSGGPGFRGLISDVRVWNVVRTQPQISSSRNVRLRGSETGLVYYWRLNEGLGSTVVDSVAAANGTISGASWAYSGDLPLLSGIPEGTWVATAGGNWSDSANWLNATVAQGVNGSAYFTNNPPSAITVTNDMTGLLLGQLYVNDSATHTFTGNGVTLTNEVTSARVISTNGTHSLDMPLITTANGASFETQTPAALTFPQVISGPGSVAVNPLTSGGGTVTFSCATNTYTGPTILGCGMVIIGTLPNGGQPSPIGTASANPANLLLGPGTLRYTGTGVTTDRGYTVQAGSSRAAILNTGADITFGGQINATSGAFVKTGTGTVTYTFPGLNKYVANEGNPTALMNIGANGDSPTTGFSGFSITQGKVVMGVPGQTNQFANHIDIGLYTTTNVNAETAAELVINSGTFICSTTVSIGRDNGTTNTAPDGTTSKLTVNGGESYISLLASGNNALGLAGFNSRSVCEINGGYVEVTTTCNMGEHAGSKISLNVNGGTLKVNGGSNSIRLGAGDGEGTLNLSAGAIEAVHDVVMALYGGAGSKGTLNLNGGTLTAASISRGSGTNAVLNLNGGVFKPRTEGRTMSGLTAANVSTNGARIDTSLANYTINQNLLHDSALGASLDGGLVKLGNNTLTLASTGSTYTGPTVVSNGTLLVTSALPADNALTVAAGGNVTVGGSATQTVSAASLELGGDGMLTFAFLSNGSSNDKLSVATTPTLGAGQIALIRADNNGLPFTLNGTYTVLTYTGADPVVSGLTPGNPVFGKHYDFAASGGNVTVTITSDTAGASLWNVNANGSWATSGNWTVAPTNAAGSQARFDDVNTHPVTVTTAGETVGELYFNSLFPYTLGGSGLNLNNSGTGAVINIESGTHAIVAPLALAGDTIVGVAPGTRLTLGAVSGGSVSLSAQGGGTLALTAAPDVQNLTLDVAELVFSNAMTVTPPITLQRTTILRPASNTTVTLSAAVSGSGGLTKAGSSTLVPAVANAYTGVTRIDAGTLIASTLANGGAASSVGASSAATANLQLGPATLRYTGSAVSVNRGYTVAAGSTRAAILRAEGDITFSGQIATSSGGFIKTGPGTVSYTYPGPNTLANAMGDNAWAVQNTSPNGDSPSVGWSGLSINQGKMILGVPGQTNSVTGRILVGLCTTTNANAETAGELILNAGVLITVSTFGVGCNNGTAVTAGPDGLQSKLTVNGGALKVGTLTLGGNQFTLPGFNAHPALVQTGGVIEASAVVNLSESSGAISRADLSGGTLRATFAGNSIAVGAGGEATLTLSGSAVADAINDVRLAVNTGSKGFINLDGGTLIARNILKGSGSEARMRFNGGVFQPRTASQTLSGLTSATVSTNGAAIDTSLASYTVAQNLLHDATLGTAADGGLVKLGTNTLSVTGAGSTFNGLIDVRAGLLKAVVCSTNSLLVATNAFFDATGLRATIRDLRGYGTLTNGTIAVTGALDAGTNNAPAGAKMTVQNLSLAQGSTFVCTWTTNALGQVTNDFVSVTGTLAPEGAGFFDLGRTGANPIPMPFQATIMSYGTLPGNFAGWRAVNTGVPAGKAVATVVTAANGFVTLGVRYGGTLVLIR